MVFDSFFTFGIDIGLDSRRAMPMLALVLSIQTGPVGPD
jgi:hypothetical protein